MKPPAYVSVKVTIYDDPYWDKSESCELVEDFEILRMSPNFSDKTHVGIMAKSVYDKVISKRRYQEEGPNDE